MIKVIDASALLASLLGEKGGEVVAAQLDFAIISTVNLSEVATRLGRDLSPEQVRVVLDTLRLIAVPPDESLAIDAGVLDRLTSRAGLSLGDRFCLALARRTGSPVITADRIWLKIADAVGVSVEAIR